LPSVPRAVGNGAAHDRDVARDGRPARRQIGRSLYVADAHGDVRAPTRAERGVRLARLRIDGHQVAVVRADEQALNPSVGPVAEVSRDEASVVRFAELVPFGVVHPPRLTCSGIQRNEESQARERIQNAVDHERRVLVARDAKDRARLLQIDFHGGPFPLHLQIVHVVGRDLIERRVLLRMG
jgi:hypothetical protein